MVNGATTAASLHNLMNKPAVDGVPHVFAKVEFDIPDHARATAGERHTIANCWVTSYQYQGGDDYDTVQITLRSTTSFPVVTEWGA